MGQIVRALALFVVFVSCVQGADLSGQTVAMPFSSGLLNGIYNKQFTFQVNFDPFRPATTSQFVSGAQFETTLYAEHTYNRPCVVTFGGVCTFPTNPGPTQQIDVSLQLYARSPLAPSHVAGNSMQYRSTPFRVPQATPIVHTVNITSTSTPQGIPAEWDSKKSKSGVDAQISVSLNELRFVDGYSQTSISGNASATLKYLPGSLRVTPYINPYLPDQYRYPSFQKDSLTLLLTARDHEEKSIAIKDAATRMGYTHFNWVQWITTSSWISSCANGTSVGINCDGAKEFLSMDYPTLPSLDFPIGGFAGDNPVLGRQTPSDMHPFYYDEDPITYPGSNSAIKFINSEIIESETLTGEEIRSWQVNANPRTALGFYFFDSPGYDEPPAPGGTPFEATFITALVGIRESASSGLYCADGTFCSWDLIDDFIFRWSTSQGHISGLRSTGAMRSLLGDNTETGIGTLSKAELLAVLGITEAEFSDRFGGQFRSTQLALVPEPMQITLLLVGLGMLAMKIHTGTAKKARISHNGRL